MSGNIYYTAWEVILKNQYHDTSPHFLMELNTNPISENNPIILLKAVSHNSQCQIHTFMVFVFTKASLYQVTCKGKVLHSTFKHRKLKITPQKYTWRVGYKVYFQLKNHNKIFCYTLLILCWYKNRCTKNMNHIFIYNTWTWLYLRHDKRPSLNALSQLK